MQVIIFPMQTVRLTQKWGTGSHRYGFPIDSAGKDSGVDNVFAPFTGIIKKIYANGNSVWIESLTPVKFADGTVDFATAMFTHDNNVSNLRVGQRINQGEVFYQEGVAGNASGNHVHIEIGKGKFTGTGWYQAANKQWVINNPYRPEMAFFVTDSNTIVQTLGLTFKKYVSDSVNVGDSIKFPKTYIVEDMKKTSYGWQVRTVALCVSGFTWNDNGIPVAPLQEVNQSGVPTSDQALAKGSLYKIPGSYTILQLGKNGNRWLAQIEMAGLKTWLDIETAVKV